MVLLIAAYSSSGHEREPTFWSSLARSGSQRPSLGPRAPLPKTRRIAAPPRRPVWRRRQPPPLVLANLTSDAGAQVDGVRDDPRRLEGTGPRLAAGGRHDARTSRVHPGAPSGKPATHVERDARRIGDDTYELGDGSTGPAADARPFRGGHALTVADGPTRTNNSGLAQRPLRQRDCDGDQSEMPTRETEVAIAQRENILPPLDPASPDVGSWCVPGLLLRSRDVGPDVDAPARQAGREASVLPLATDGEAELVVRDDDPRRLGSRVDDLDARHARR